MILCIKCNITKPISDFYIRYDRLDQVQSMCKQCFNAYCCDRWKQRKLDAIKKMGDKCVDCKISYHYSVYDFHHLYDKDLQWNKLRLRSQDTIDKELSKCILLCSNCHRIRHYQ